MSKKTLAEVALWYLEQGLHIVPLVPRGKKPLVPWQEFQDRPPTEEEVNSWWSRWPDANIGVLTGVGRVPLVVVDADSAQGATWCTKNVNTPWTVKTGKLHGRHFYLRMGDNRIPNAHFFGIDLWGHGGYVVAAPSVHESGVQYVWQGVDGARFPDLPVIDPALIKRLADWSGITGDTKNSRDDETNVSDLSCDLHESALHYAERGDVDEARYLCRSAAGHLQESRPITGALRTWLARALNAAAEGESADTALCIRRGRGRSTDPWGDDQRDMEIAREVHHLYTLSRTFKNPSDPSEVIRRIAIHYGIRWWIALAMYKAGKGGPNLSTSEHRAERLAEAADDVIAKLGEPTNDADIKEIVRELVSAFAMNRLTLENDLLAAWAKRGEAGLTNENARRLWGDLRREVTDIMQTGGRLKESALRLSSQTVKNAVGAFGVVAKRKHKSADQIERIYYDWRDVIIDEEKLAQEFYQTRLETAAERLAQRLPIDDLQERQKVLRDVAREQGVNAKDLAAALDERRNSGHVRSLGARPATSTNNAR